MRRLRALLFLVPLLAGEGRPATASEPLGSIEIEHPTIVVVPAPFRLEPVPAAMGPIEAPEEEPDLEVELDEVRWTVEQQERVDLVAGRWGLHTRHLVALNPDLRGREAIPAGAELKVYELDAEAPTRSIGSPNKGRLQNGLPMPEGPYWELRDRRTRAFGATNAIRAMVTAFDRYGRSFDDAPPVSVGEISGRRGGRAHPHSSHRSGRDVDLGYILLPGTEGEQWKRADEDNFDVEKNWALIKALVDTGEVQLIFISSRLQRLLEPVARAELGEEEIGRYFRVPGQDPEHGPILRHWDGHRDHMHVRFRCEPGNTRCRSRSATPIDE